MICWAKESIQTRYCSNVVLEKPFYPITPTISLDALIIIYKVFWTRTCTNVFMDYNLLELPNMIVTCSTGLQSIFRPELTSIFPISPVDTLCNYRKSHNKFKRRQKFVDVHFIYLIYWIISSFQSRNHISSYFKIKKIKNILSRWILQKL